MSSNKDKIFKCHHLERPSSSAKIRLGRSTFPRLTLKTKESFKIGF